MKSIKILSQVVLLAFLIVSCGNSSPLNQSGGNQVTNIEIQVTGTEVVELGTETVLQPNCSGTAEVENTIEKARTIQYVIEVQNGASVNANGQVGFAGTDVELGATVASQFGQSYGTSETLTRSITVKAKPGTNMQHTIRQAEIWKIGEAKVSVGGQQTIIPFKFRSDFAIELVNSQNLYPVGCNLLPSATDFPPQQSGVDCSFINELTGKADVIQYLYEGQSLAGAQVKLVSPVDVPTGWIVQFDGKDYLGPVHFDSGIVASFWSPHSCRPLSLGGNLSTGSQVSNDFFATYPITINGVSYDVPTSASPYCVSSEQTGYTSTGVEYDLNIPQGWVIIWDSWKAYWNNGKYEQDGLLVIYGEWEGTVTVVNGEYCAVPTEWADFAINLRASANPKPSRQQFVIGEKP